MSKEQGYFSHYNGIDIEIICTQPTHGSRWVIKFRIIRDGQETPWVTDYNHSYGSEEEAKQAAVQQAVEMIDRKARS